MLNGGISSKSINIPEQFTDHWGGVMEDTNSFKSRPSPSLLDDQEVLMKTITETLSSDESILLSSPLTDIEMCEAIKHMSGHSSPGMDGYPASFYQIAPEVFGECLRIVFD